MLEKLNEILTIKNVTSEFYNFEKELNLLNIQIQEVFFWKIIRFSTWMHIVNHYGLYGQAHLSLNHTPIQRKISNLKKIYNTEVNSYISRKKPVDILVFEHPRKVQIDGKYTDIYTNSKVEEIKRNNFSYEIVDSPYLDKHYDKPNKYSFVKISTAFNKLSKLNKVSPSVEKLTLLISRFLFFSLLCIV